VRGLILASVLLGVFPIGYYISMAIIRSF